MRSDAWKTPGKRPPALRHIAMESIVFGSRLNCGESLAAAKVPMTNAVIPVLRQRPIGLIRAAGKESDQKTCPRETPTGALAARPPLSPAVARLALLGDQYRARPLIVGTVPPIMLAQIRWTGAGLILLPFVLHCATGR